MLKQSSKNGNGIMRQVVSALTVFFLFISFCGCAFAQSKTNEEKEYNKACELIEEGKYDEAIAILSEIDSYKKISKKITEAQKLKEAAIEAAKPDSHPIEITMDNWSEYFEMGDITAWRVNGFNEVDGLSILYYLKLKDDYNDMVDFDKSDITVQYEYDSTWYNVDVDFETKTYELKDRTGDWHYEKTAKLEHKEKTPYKFDGAIFEDCEKWEYWLNLTACRFWINASNLEPQIPDYPYSLELKRIGGNLYLFDEE